MNQWRASVWMLFFCADGSEIRLAVVRGGYRTTPPDCPSPLWERGDR
ncbi:hypothetical protein [Rossellomorea marisflavi]